MAVCVIAALLVLALVAVPRLRGGEKLLTRDGEQTVRDASRRARALASQAVDRAGVVAADVRDKAEEARSRRATESDAAEADAWSAPTAVRPAASSPQREPGSGARTATLAAPVAVSPAQDATAPPVGPAPQVIDLREPTAKREAPAEPSALATRRQRRHRDADLGWGEPRPGPRHSR